MTMTTRYNIDELHDIADIADTADLGFTVVDGPTERGPSNPTM